MSNLVLKIILILFKLLRKAMALAQAEPGWPTFRPKARASKIASPGPQKPSLSWGIQAEPSRNITNGHHLHCHHHHYPSINNGSGKAAMTKTGRSGPMTRV